MRSKLGQLILIPLNCSFQMESISCFELGLRREISQTYPLMMSAKQGSIRFHFYNVFSITQSGTKPTTSSSRYKNCTNEPLLRCFYWHISYFSNSLAQSMALPFLNKIQQRLNLDVFCKCPSSHGVFTRKSWIIP